MKFARWFRFALAFAAVATVYFHRLDQPLLWDDEADTGVNARNVLHSGVPSAFDGRNVLYFDNGAQLNRSLLSKEIPWVQYYLGALSLALFGNTTAGLRALFAAAGLLAFLPLWAALGRRVKYPEIAAALVLLAPQTVLFQRNARYYPILILLYACLVWHLSRDFRSGRVRFATGAVIFVLLFHTHPFAAACAAAALLLYCLFWRRPHFAAYLGAAALGFLSWFAWYRLLGPPLVVAPHSSASVVFSNLGAAGATVFRDFLATLVDLDAVGSLPLLLLAAAVAIILVRNWRDDLRVVRALDKPDDTEVVPPRLAALCREPLFGFVLLSILVQAAATAAVFGTEAGPGFALLRYMPHLAAFALAACFVAADAAVSSALPAIAVCVFAVACNFGTLSFWAKPFGRQVPASWAAPVYAEIFRPTPDVWDGVIAELRRDALPVGDGESVIFAVPEWTQAMLTFYLGDAYLVPPDTFLRTRSGWMARGPAPYLRQVLGDEAYRRLNAHPAWIVDSIHEFANTPDGFVTAAIIPSYRASPHNASRPELTRHEFPHPEPVAAIALYHWQAAP